MNMYRRTISTNSKILANAGSKEVKVYALPDSPRCLVKLLDKYLEKLPPGAQYIYMRPLDKIPTDPTKPWYTKQRVGYNMLKGFVPKLRMC